jgi:hypothetical protein
MPEPVMHFSVIFALTSPWLGVKKALLLSSIALMPDLDALVHIHRSMSHSVIILTLSYAPILLAVYKFKPGYFRLAALGLLVLLSHIVMDLFQTYTPILYPILDSSLWVEIDGGVQISPSGLKPQVSADVKHVPTTFKPFEVIDAPVFTSGGFLISLILTVIPLIICVKDGKF